MKYETECDNLEELIIAIEKLPDTIKYLQVQNELQHFQPRCDTLKWSEDLAEKSRKIITKALEEEDKWGKIDKFYLRSYFGSNGKKDPYYISLSSKESRDFGQRMAAGDFGSLD